MRATLRPSHGPFRRFHRLVVPRRLTVKSGPGLTRRKESRDSGITFLSQACCPAVSVWSRVAKLRTCPRMTLERRAHGYGRSSVWRFQQLGLILDFLFNAVARVTVQPWNPELVEQPATAEEILRSGRSLAASVSCLWKGKPREGPMIEDS